MTVSEAPAAGAGSGFGFMQATEPAAPPAGSAFGFMQTSEPPAPPAGSSFNFRQEKEARAPANVSERYFDLIQASPPVPAAEVTKGSSFDFMQNESTQLISPNPTNKARKKR